MEQKLYRPREGRVVAGVCLGLADYFKIDVAIIRVIFIIMALGKGAGVLIYLILMIALPEEGGRSYADDIKDAAKKGGDKSAAKNVAKAAEKVKDAATSNKKGAEIVALILIALGLVFLLQNIFPVWINFDNAWPLLLVLLGAMILISGRKA